ncbi:uncharacterized protein B0I36DRAFT_364396 [Microdochium trichocladiopsis]|uniref:Uncharacterized protein n=1 Tax=Microdochium trichocladiopsis TaxID=1682393 RepID=A0A9P8Y5V4_9PEZI|nr:uncharacterized protein B0I36DRAFT_364396 [Microdochium trichocladiopsis]KAH7029929.1 hypothetical protein B0I36DRAFT_364396 [Microdochium trichocladiopsis]
MAEVKEKGPGRVRIETNLSQEEFIKVINTKRHFLGLFENASVRIGTKDSRADSINRVHINNIRESPLRNRIVWTRVINFSLAGGFLISVGASTGIRIRTAKERPRSLEVESTDEKIIEQTLENSTILYETQTKVAWMLPRISVVMYLVQAWARRNDPETCGNIRYPTFGQYEAVLIAPGCLLRALEDEFWIQTPAPLARINLKEVFMYFAKTLDRLQDDEDLKPAPRLHPNRLAGVDFANLASQPRNYSIVTVDVQVNYCGDWLRMLKSDWEDHETQHPNAPYRVVTLFCNNIDPPPLLPQGTVCGTWSPPPPRRDYLVVPMYCLRRLTDIYGKDPVMFSREHHCECGPRLPFQPCGGQQICNPLQRIVTGGRQEYREMTEWIQERRYNHAAFIFGNAFDSERHCRGR